MNKQSIKNIFNSYPFRLILFLELIFIVFRILFVALLFLKAKSIDAVSFLSSLKEVIASLRSLQLIIFIVFILDLSAGIMAV